MIRVVLVIAVIWLVLMPPFFTKGACDAEFSEISAVVTDNKKDLATPELAQAFWSARHVPVQAISAAQCRRAKPRFVEDCGPGISCL